MPPETEHTGYLNKIAYHAYVGNHSKVIYFTDMQIMKYGPITPIQQMEIGSTIRCLFLEAAIKREREFGKLIKPT